MHLTAVTLALLLAAPAAAVAEDFTVDPDLGHRLGALLGAAHLRHGRQRRHQERALPRLDDEQEVGSEGLQARGGLPKREARRPRPGGAGALHRRDPLHRLRALPRRRRQGEAHRYGLALPRRELRPIRVRATIAGLDRDAYRIGPKFTEGWLARVQKLAKVVAETGTIDLSLFAKAK